MIYFQFCSTNETAAYLVPILKNGWKPSKFTRNDECCTVRQVLILLKLTKKS